MGMRNPRLAHRSGSRPVHSVAYLVVNGPLQGVDDIGAGLAQETEDLSLVRARQLNAPCAAPSPTAPTAKFQADFLAAVLVLQQRLQHWWAYSATANKPVTRPEQSMLPTPVARQTTSPSPRSMASNIRRHQKPHDRGFFFMPSRSSVPMGSAGYTSALSLPPNTGADCRNRPVGGRRDAGP